MHMHNTIEYIFKMVQTKACTNWNWMACTKVSKYSGNEIIYSSKSILRKEAYIYVEYIGCRT